jgi:hypothetical protein
MYTTIRGASFAFCLFSAGLSISGAVGEASAQTGERERLAQCDRDLCEIIRMPLERGAPLQCDLGTTLYKEQIDKIARAWKLSWPFGDARCSVKVDVPRSLLSRALTDDNYKLELPPHATRCEVEYKGQPYPVTVTLAPQIEFADGQATSVTLNVRQIDANILIKALLWSAAKLEDTVGIFQEGFVDSVNHYVERHCRGGTGGSRQVRLEDIPLPEKNTTRSTR